MGQGKVHKADNLYLLLEENKKFRLILEQLYQEFGVRRETFEFCYLYVMKEVYCINDVIRIRRQMFGLKAEALYGGICTKKTLSNIENKKTVAQRAVAEKLLEKLGLSGNRTKTEIVTNDPRARELERQLRDEINDVHYNRADELFQELRHRITDKIPCNRQFLEKQGALIDRYLGRISYRPVIQAGMQETLENMYELIMGSVGSLLRDRREYDKADEINETIIKGCLRFRRIGSLH